MPSAHGTNSAGRSGGQMIVAIIATVVAAIVIFGGGAYLFTKAFTGSIHSFDETNTITLVPSEFKNSLDVEGTVKATSGVSVSPEVDGTVEKVEVKDGDEVKEGDVLFTMKNDTLTKAAQSADTTYQKALDLQDKAQKAYDKAADALKAAEKKRSDAEEEAHQSAREQAEAQNALNAAEAQVEAVASDSDADEDAGDEEDAQAEESEEAVAEEPAAQVTEDDFFSFDSTSYDAAVETATEAQKNAKEALDTAKSTTSTAREAYENARDKVQQLTVKASKGGTVTECIVEEGMTTAALNAKGAAMRIVDLDTLMGMVKIPEAAIGSVSVGMDCVVTLGTGSNTRQVNAMVYKVADTPDKADSKDDKDDKGDAAGTGSTDNDSSQQGTTSASTYTVQLTLDTLPENVKDGMAIKANIEMRDYGTVFYVPTSAVGENGTGAYVEVVYNDNTTKEHSVTVLDTTDDGEAIIQGNALVKDMTIRSDVS